MHARTNVILVVHSRTRRHRPDTSTIHKARAGLSVICVPAGRPTSRRHEFVGPEPHLLAVAQSRHGEAVLGHGFAGVNGPVPVSCVRCADELITDCPADDGVEYVELGGRRRERNRLARGDSQCAIPAGLGGLYRG
jgi:hypothetical protein